jgi:hypothetical protein
VGQESKRRDHGLDEHTRSFADIPGFNRGPLIRRERARDSTSLNLLRSAYGRAARRRVSGKPDTLLGERFDPAARADDGPGDHLFLQHG